MTEEKVDDCRHFCKDNSPFTAFRKGTPEYSRRWEINLLDLFSPLPRFISMKQEQIFSLKQVMLRVETKFYKINPKVCPSV